MRHACMFNAALNLALSIRNNAANTLRQQLLCILIHVKLQGIIQDRHHVFHAHNFRAVDLDRCAVAEDEGEGSGTVPFVGFALWPTTSTSTLGLFCGPVDGLNVLALSLLRRCFAPAAGAVLGAQKWRTMMGS